MQECVHKFPMSVAGVDKAPETEKLVLATPSTTPPDQVRQQSLITSVYVRCVDKKCSPRSRF